MSVKITATKQDDAGGGRSEQVLWKRVAWSVLLVATAATSLHNARGVIHVCISSVTWLWAPLAWGNYIGTTTADNSVWDTWAVSGYFGAMIIAVTESMLVYSIFWWMLTTMKVLWLTRCGCTNPLPGPVNGANFVDHIGTSYVRVVDENRVGRVEAVAFEAGLAVLRMSNGIFYPGDRHCRKDNLQIVGHLRGQMAFLPLDYYESFLRALVSVVVAVLLSFLTETLPVVSVAMDANITLHEALVIEFRSRSLTTYLSCLSLKIGKAENATFETYAGLYAKFGGML